MVDNGKHRKETHSTKMGADKSAEDTQNATKFICPKVGDFDEKRLHWVSVVLGALNCISLYYTVSYS